MKESLGFPQTIYVCGKPRGCCVLYFVEMIYACGKPRCCFAYFCLLYFVQMIYVCGKRGFPQTYIISTKYKNK
jgi:hypothetical protein